MEIIITIWLIFNLYKAYTTDRKNADSNRKFIEDLIQNINDKLKQNEVIDLSKLLSIIIIFTLATVNIMGVSICHDYTAKDIFHNAGGSLILFIQIYTAGYDILATITSYTYNDVFKILFTNNDIKNSTLKLIMYIACCVIGLEALINAFNH